jgi:hypothetical protein
MKPLRRWHPWRRRLHAWVTRWAECWLKPPPEPRWHRAEDDEDERELQTRLRRDVARGLGVNG